MLKLLLLLQHFVRFILNAELILKIINSVVLRQNPQ